MPAKSKSQQRFMGMVYAIKSGNMKLDDLPENLQDKVGKAVKGISTDDAKKYASTKTKDLPTKVEEKLTFLEFAQVFEEYEHQMVGQALNPKNDMKMRKAALKRLKGKDATDKDVEDFVASKREVMNKKVKSQAQEEKEANNKK